MTPTMPLKDAIALIDSGNLFDIEFCTCDRKRGTGGSMRAFKGIVKYTTQQLPKSKRPKEEQKTKGKAASHGLHFTRNLYNQRTREIIKVHVLLITTINGKRIL